MRHCWPEASLWPAHVVSLCADPDTAQPVTDAGGQWSLILSVLIAVSDYITHSYFHVHITLARWWVSCKFNYMDVVFWMWIILGVHVRMHAARLYDAWKNGKTCPSGVRPKNPLRWFNAPQIWLVGVQNYMYWLLTHCINLKYRWVVYYCRKTICISTTVVHVLIHKDQWIGAS